MKQQTMTGRASALVAIFIIATLLVLVLATRQVYRLSTSPVWLASNDLEIGHIISPQSLVRGRSGEEGGVENPRALLGKQLEVAKKKGELIRAFDLTTAPKSWLAAKVPEGRVLYTLTPKQTTIPHSQIRFGDRLDIVVKGSQGVRTVATNTLLMGAVTSGNGNGGRAAPGGLMASLAPPSDDSKGHGGTPLVFAVLPTDVYSLAGIGSNEVVTLVLHGEAEAATGERLNIASHRQVEVVSGLERSRKVVRN